MNGRIIDYSTDEESDLVHYVTIWTGQHVAVVCRYAAVERQYVRATDDLVNCIDCIAEGLQRSSSKPW